MPIDEKYFDDLNKAAEAFSDASLDLCSDKLIPNVVPESAPCDDTDNCECDPYSPGITATFPEQELIDLQNLMLNAEKLDDQELNEALDCADKIQAAGEDIQKLTEKLMAARETEANLEMLWYNYRIPARYHQEKLKAFDVLLKTFDPLVREKRFIEAQLIGSVGDPTLQDKLNEINTKLDQAKSNTYNTFEAIFNAPPGGAIKKVVLQGILKSIGEGQDFLTFPIRATAFSGRCIILPVPDFNPGDGVSFKTTIQHKFSDPAGLLNGKPKTYLASNPFRNPVIVIPFEGPAFGTLYNNLYGIWDDQKKFFTPEERSLTSVKSQADPESSFTKVDNYYIKDINGYYDFMSNYPKHVYDKADIIKQTIIEPALQDVSPNAEDIALREVSAILAYGAAGETELMDDNGDLKTAVEASREASDKFLEKLNELSNDLNFIRLRVQQYQQAIDTAIDNLKKSPCVNRGDTTEGVEEEPAGTDPIGLKTLSGNKITLPNPTKFCYWRKFAQLATMINVLPLPGSGGFRYWPIGLVIPTPNGVVKVPLPIVWIPITVITLKAGIMVVFIAQCGVSPGPIIFMHGSDGKKKFVVSPRPGKIFGSDVSLSTIKTVDELGLATKIKTDSFLNKISIPNFEPVPLSSKNTAVNDIKKKVMSAVNKLEFPAIDISIPGFSFSKYAEDLIDKLNVPDISVPRDHRKTNPRPTQTQELLLQLKTLSRQGLPAISLGNNNISLRDVVLNQIDKSALEIQPPDWPGNQGDIDAAAEKFVQWHKKIIESAVGKVTPKLLGVFPIIQGDITIINPYKCRQETDGFIIPEPPKTIAFTLAAIVTAMQPMPKEQIVQLLGSLPLTPYAVGALGTNALKNLMRTIPPFNIPDPSNVSIGSQMKDSVKKLFAFQKKQKIDPTKPPLALIVIPGEAIEVAIKKQVRGLARQISIPSTSTSADLKVMFVNMVEGTLDQVEQIVNPIMNTIEFIGDFSPGSLLEKFGLSLSEPGNNIAYVSQPILKQSMELLAAIPAAAYVLVATSPDTFKNLHPLLTQDDLPPWERLTLKNFLLVVFLDIWCKEGKKVGGLFENP